MTQSPTILQSASGADADDDAARFKLLVESITGCAIYMLDVDGRVTSWNAGAEKLTGYAAHEIIGRHFSRFFGDDDKARGLPKTALEAALRVGCFEADGWRLRKDGTRFWANAIVEAIRDDAGELIGFANVTRDISEQRVAQQSQVEGEQRFRMLVQGVVDYAIYMLDPIGLVTNWNVGAERLKGYAPAEVIGRHFSLFYTAEDRAAGLPARALETAARTGKFEAEGWRVRKDGSRFVALVVIDAIRDAGGKLIGYAKITRDVTQQRAERERLEESERMFRLLVNGITDYALYMLDLNGNVSSWNSGAERIKGYTAGEIVGEHFSRFYTDTDRAAGVPAQALAAAAGTGRFEAEGWRVRKDGTFLWASVVIDAIRDETGRLIGYAKITRDISERREAQLAMQRMQTQLAEAQKMDALGQLTGGVAHDFNNLLMIVSGHLSTLKKLTADDPKGVRAAEAVQIATQRGAALTRQLLTFARRQQVNPTALSVGGQIAALVDVLNSALGSSIQLTLDIPASTWPVNVDVNEFEIALVNLVLNARDAMPDGGSVMISAENVGDSGELGEHVALTVADTGMGIAPDVIGKIFDPFFTTKGVGKGTGLGLSQVFGFAHQAGGSVKANSTLGMGTRITLCLPRSRALPGSAAGADAVPGIAVTGTVLLVEDNPDVSAASVGMLEQLGYRVETVSDAASALAMLESGRRINAVISDVVMPGRIDGFALARALREKDPALPVLLVTGYADASREARDEFIILPKPYDVHELRAALLRVSSAAKQASNLVAFDRSAGG